MPPRTRRASRQTKGSPLRSKRPAASGRAPLNILFTCVGRRIELLEAFARAARSLRIDLTLHATDINWTAPAMHRVDRPHIVPAIADDAYIPTLLTLARKHDIDLIIPTIDSDLLPLARAAAGFAEIGTRVVISSESVVRTCQDKLASFELLARTGIDTPDTWRLSEALRRTDHRFPYYLKPREGSAGKGNYVVRTIDELRVLGARVPDAIVQEFVPGDEHTLDIYTGFDGRPRCVVPRKRLEVRRGEVSKGIVSKDPRVIAVGNRVVEVLAECRGVVTVQCMLTPDGRVRVIEINPRFGGGAPLAIAAGADLPRWLMAEHLGRKVTIDPRGYRDGLAMLRYDESVFVEDLSRELG